MKIFICILFSLYIFTNNLLAQTFTDSLYIQRIDSIRQDLKKQNNFLIHKQFNDTLNNRAVVKSFDNSKLNLIYYANYNFVCNERATFYIQNDSLIYIEYTLSGPDLRSGPPESITYSVYFKNDIPIHNSTSNYLWDLNRSDCKLKDKDFVKEFYFYKNFKIQ